MEQKSPQEGAQTEMFEEEEYVEPGKEPVSVYVQQDLTAYGKDGRHPDPTKIFID